MDYLALLEHSYSVAKDDECPPETRLEFLAEYIFDFTTYDSSMSELFAVPAVAVCAAINERKSFDFIKEPDNYKWYLLMCNMPFFSNKLEWGTSIRGAWWKHEPIILETYGLWDGNEQLINPTFSTEEWPAFIAALLAFAATPDGRHDG